MESNSSPNPLVKAAALAWYKHATGGAPPPSPRSSSHLVGSSAAASPKKTPPSSPAITLLDVYEVEWITTQLERLISSSSSSSSSFSASVSSVESGDRRWMGTGRKNVRRKGLGFGSSFGRHAMSLCGSFREAVMETPSNIRGKRGDIGFRV